MFNNSERPRHFILEMKLLPLLILFTAILFPSVGSVAGFKASERKRIKRQYYGYSYPSYPTYGYSYPSYGYRYPSYGYGYPSYGYGNPFQSGLNLLRVATMFIPSGRWWNRNQNG
ncbi:hypothetical protein NECAME_13112 [Necator americanus]|uniref:Uncharacterized protein n=1 Tax=Necator americanus TaxID=51031 RepID=W2SZ18_NECAM|nr:hypothetical protein NECAME_13112 [Necator americanus]ETN74206.1 hypothetical protein NECAME_13112 [Necator americanus]